jgi:hypothetical protein
MLHVVTSTQVEGQPSDAFVTKPKVLYRLGNKYGRVEEADDPEHRLHLLFVVSEPDLWVVNRSDGTGQHMVDRGPSLNFRAPALQAVKSAEWNEFEFGCEEAFMTARGVKPVSDSAGNLTYAYDKEDVSVRLVVSTDHKPKSISAKIPEATLRLNYLTYEWLQPDLSLFQRPANIAFRERTQP